jgi:outer membrane protein OmpA-like peptidoglycan-associated protein
MTTILSLQKLKISDKFLLNLQKFIFPPMKIKFNKQHSTMRGYLFLLLFISCSTIFGQFTTGEITYGNKLDLNNTNSWAVGGGFSNFIMHGDLRSVGTGDQGNFWNFGGYVYVDRMFNPLLGLEFKLNYTKISGGAQYFSSIYEVLYVSGTNINNDLFFEGSSYGAELNLILSFSNLYEMTSVKWNAAGYFGVGYHQYDSALFNRNTNGTKNLLVDFGENPARNSVNTASSIFLSAQLGIKRRINSRIDLEVRTGMYFNYEDHLDAAISNKQDWETFFTTNIGLVVKLGKKKIFTIWGEEDKRNEFKIVDTDGDGVMDGLDIEPNTPKNVLVYGNGKAVDADKDGIPDYKDKCPLEYGLIANEGCPIDTDGDGVYDDNDLCPIQKGSKENKGCPEIPEVAPNNNIIIQNINELSANIYFPTGKFIITKKSVIVLDKIAKLILGIPDVSFNIDGHTDNIDQRKKNLYLSKKRADAVRKYLIRKGIDSKRLKANGYGETRPKYSNETIESRQLNRRVEITPMNTFR